MSKHTKEELTKLQALSLDEKIEITEARILEFYHKMEGNVYVSFSGGKDSTVLLHIVRNILPRVEAVFCDTGLEFPEVKEFVRSFENVTIIRPKKTFRQVIDEYGYPVISKEVSDAVARLRANPDSDVVKRQFQKGRIVGKQYSMARWEYLKDAPFKTTASCCYHLKKAPFKVFHKKTKKKPYVGTTCAESQLRERSWLINGCNSFEAGLEKSRPLSIWTEADIWEYIERYNVPIVSVYTHGRQRVGCIYCAFGAHLEKEPNRFQILQKTHPQLYEYCMKPKEEGGLGLGPVLDYLEIKRVNDRVIKKRVIIRDADRVKEEEKE